MHHQNKRAIANSVLIAGLFQITAAAASDCVPGSANRPICPAASPALEASFIDPTVIIRYPSKVSLGKQTYLGPFTELNATGMIQIGEKTNLQDNVTVSGVGNVSLGDEVILAHGAQVRAPAKLGGHSAPGATQTHQALFLGFNSVLDGANMEVDSMVLHLARVAPGITIRSGKVVLSGKYITTQAQADDPALGKVIPVTDALRKFMEGVLHVNTSFAREYTNLARSAASSVRGINLDPGQSADAHEVFNPYRDTPVLAGVNTISSNYRNRIIGKVRMADSFAKLSSTVFGSKIALRADEGEAFDVGRVSAMADRTTFHALEFNAIKAGHDVVYGFRSIVHGGESEATRLLVTTQDSGHGELPPTKAVTVIGDRTHIGNYAVVFKSAIGAGVKIGCGSLVEASKLPAGTVIAPRTIIQNYGFSGSVMSRVEWNPGCDG